MADGNPERRRDDDDDDNVDDGEQEVDEAVSRDGRDARRAPPG